MSYPTNLDNPAGQQAQGGSSVASPDHALDHRTLGSAVVNIETKIGIGSGTPTNNTALVGSGNGTSSWSGTLNNFTFGTPQVTGGTANNLRLGTPIIGTISVAGTVSALSFGGAYAPGQGTLVDSAGGTLIANAQTAQIYYCALGTTAGNRTIGTPTNPTAYQDLHFAFKASGSANGTLVWGSAFRFSQSLPLPTLGNASSWNYYDWRYNAIDSRWDLVGETINIIDSAGSITRDNSAYLGQVNSTSLTASYTCNGVNRALFVGVTAGINGSSNVSGVTYAGGSMTCVGSVQVPNSFWIYLFSLYGPASGANNVVVTLGTSSPVQASVVSYNGGSATDASTLGTSTNGTSVIGTVTTTTTYDWIVAYGVTDTGAIAAGTNSFLLPNADSGIKSLFDSNGAIAAASSVPFGVTNSVGTANLGILIAAMQHV